MIPPAIAIVENMLVVTVVVGSGAVVVSQSPVLNINPPVLNINPEDITVEDIINDPLAATDSSKSEKHGDKGRALDKAEQQIKDIDEALQDPGISRKERDKLKQKKKNIMRDAHNKRKGEEHSRGPKR